MPFPTFPVQCGIIFVLWYKMLDDVGADYVLDISSVQLFGRDIGTGLLCRLLSPAKKATNLHKTYPMSTGAKESSCRIW